MFNSSSFCTVTHDIMIEGRMAFRAGERVIIQTVSPNQQRPEYKYVVMSAKLGQRFQLREEDLRTVPTPPIQKKAELNKPQRNVPGEAHTGRNAAILIGVFSAIIVVILIAAAIMNSNKTETSTPAETSTTAAPVTPAVQKTWQTVYTFSGNASRRSESFTITGDEQKLSYNVTGETAVMCGIYVMDKGTSLESGGFKKTLVNE